MEKGAATASRAKRLDWQVETRIFTYGRVVWAIHSFLPLKKKIQEEWDIPSPFRRGMGGPCPHLVRIFPACLAKGYVPATRP
jgi:hypothetical protein